MRVPFSFEIPKLLNPLLSPLVAQALPLLSDASARSLLSQLGFNPTTTLLEPAQRPQVQQYPSRDNNHSLQHHGHDTHIVSSINLINSLQICYNP